MQYEEKPLDSSSTTVYRPKDTSSSSSPSSAVDASADKPREVTEVKVATTSKVVPESSLAEAASSVGPESSLAAGGEGGPHEKTMTEKMKEMLIDTAHVAKEKALGALHVAYEKIHDAGIAVEDRTAQMLKNIGHAQQNKADELEQDATQKRIEVAHEPKVPVTEGVEGVESRPKSPSILTKAYNKIHDTGIAVEEKAAHFLKGVGHSQQNKAAELEGDAGAKRTETFRGDEGSDKSILDKAKEKVQTATIEVEQKAADALKGMSGTNKKAGDLEQDAGQERFDTAAEQARPKSPSLLEKAASKIQSVTNTVEDSAARALNEMGRKNEQTASELQWDASQRRRTPTPGRISPQVLQSYGAVSANLEEKAARIRGEGREFSLDSIIPPSSFHHQGAASSSSSAASSSVWDPSSSKQRDYSASTRMPKEVPPPEERKVIPDPVD